MATLGDIKEYPLKEDLTYLLTCTICLETFKQSKVLPCLHTFCETCLSSYIVSTVKEEKPEGFKCPLCRRLVLVGNIIAKPETWVKTLPANHFINSLIDRRAMEQGEKLCDVCSNENFSQKAISWCTICDEAYCDACEINHKKYKMARNHKIVSIQDISEDTSFGNVFELVACDKHPDKTIETFCEDHSKPCCTVCATVHHSKCEHFVAIDKAVTGIKKSMKAQKLMMELKETSNNLEIIIDNRKKSTTNFEKGIDVVLTEISNMRQTLNDRLDELELKINQEVKSVRKTSILRLNEEIGELVTLKSSFDYWKHIFSACLSRGSEIHCLIKMNDISSQMPLCKNDLSTVLKSIRDISIKFETMNIISDTMCFGHLHSKEHKPSLLGKMHVVFTIDVRGAYTSGIFFEDDIIITEYNKNRISYHGNTGKQVDTLEFETNERPTDIIKVNDHTIAASIDQLCSYGKIFIMNVKPLTLIKTVNINVGMFGICIYIREEIIAHSSIISLSNIEHGVKLDEYHATFVGRQKEKKNIFRNAHSIRFQSLVGTHVDCKSTLSTPFHQNIDLDGNIYIVEHYAKSIHQVTPDGQIARTIALSDIDEDMTERPWVMRFKPNTNKFLVTFHGPRSKVSICEII